MVNKNKKKLGDLLIESGVLSKEILHKMLQMQEKTGKKLGELLIDEGVLKESQIMKILQEQLGIAYINFDKFFIEPEVPRLISENLAKKYLLIPIQKEGRELIVAMSDPLNLIAIDDVAISTGLIVKPAIAPRKAILNAIDQYYGKETAERAVEDFKKQYKIDQISDVDTELLNEVSNAPIVRFVNSIIQQAVKAKASDIHIEPYEKDIRIRFRVDGELQEIMRSSKSTHSGITTRIKILGKMDIAEKRIPQDGRIETVVDDKDLDLRISILPTIYGEKIVIRLLERSNFIYSKAQLGFTNENINLFDKIIKSPNGIILVTGPTGSGKTTTLYSVLRELNKVNKNVITVEDPVEYRLEGINQVQVNLKAGLNFADGLRSILRQDPDTIMIGEIRDTETAQIAIRAAITGHLVLSTMHTNDSASTVSRLLDMDIEPYLVSSSLVGVVSQRLVKKICLNCKSPYDADEFQMESLGLSDCKNLFKGNGCIVCNNTGYKGRTAIHEIMLVNKDLRLLIDRRANIDEIREAAAKSGTKTLRDNCLNLVRQGITTLDEMLEVTYSME